MSSSSVLDTVRTFVQRLTIRPSRSGPSPNLAVPRTNSTRAQTIKGSKRHRAVSGYRHTLYCQLAGYCRAHSYLLSADNHGIRPIDAIHAAPYRQPWAPHHLNGMTPLPKS